MKLANVAIVLGFVAWQALLVPAAMALEIGQSRGDGRLIAQGGPPTARRHSAVPALRVVNWFCTKPSGSALLPDSRFMWRTAGNCHRKQAPPFPSAMLDSMPLTQTAWQLASKLFASAMSFTILMDRCLMITPIALTVLMLSWRTRPTQGGQRSETS